LRFTKHPFTQGGVKCRPRDDIHPPAEQVLGIHQHRPENERGRPRGTSTSKSTSLFASASSRAIAPNTCTSRNPWREARAFKSLRCRSTSGCIRSPTFLSGLLPKTNKLRNKAKTPAETPPTHDGSRNTQSGCPGVPRSAAPALRTLNVIQGRWNCCMAA
jgi:hypothetical protein